MIDSKPELSEWVPRTQTEAEGSSAEVDAAEGQIADTNTVQEGVSTEPAPVTEALSWTGWKIDGLGGSGVGRVEGVITDIDTREPVWLLVRMGRFGHFSAIPYVLAAPGSGRIWVPFERDTLRSAPRVDAGSPLTREHELELCAYYGIPEDQGRAAQIASRASGAATAQLLASN